MSRKLVIAIVDDDASVLKALGRLFSDCGYTVEKFASAGEFLAAAPKSEAACLLVDIGLGDISGLDMVRQLIAAGFKFPVIFMSGFAEERFRTEAKELGCVAFLQKPFSPDLLVATVNKAIEGKSSSDND